MCHAFHTIYLVPFFLCKKLDFMELKKLFKKAAYENGIISLA